MRALRDCERGDVLRGVLVGWDRSDEATRVRLEMTMDKGIRCNRCRVRKSRKAFKVTAYGRRHTCTTCHDRAKSAPPGTRWCSRCKRYQASPPERTHAWCRDCHAENARYQQQKRADRAPPEREAHVVRHWCSACAGLAHRRPYSGCRECREPWAPDVYQVNLPMRSSNLARVMNSCLAVE
jgi:hypothetical protein